MSRVSQRLGAIAESATMAITGRARAMRAAGRDVISYGAGEPDFPTPAHIVEAAVAACRDPRNHKYSAAGGLPELREAIAGFTAATGGVETTPDRVVVTNGGKQAVFESFAALLGPGDEAIVPAPYWVTYPEAIRLAGATPVAVSTGSDSGFKVSVDQLEAARTPRTKLLVFVSPSNPTGAVYTAAEIGEIGRWAGEHGIWVVTDEIYHRLVYGDADFVSMPATVPELEDRWVVVNGVAKTFAMTGWRVGWMIGPPDVVQAATNMQSHLTSNVANVSQRAAIAALTGPMDAVDEMRRAFDRRRATMHRMLNAIPGVTCVEPMGAFYCFPDFRGVLEGGRFESTLDLGAHVLEEAEVAMVPGEAFGAPGYARLSYALADDDLERGLERLGTVLG